MITYMVWIEDIHEGVWSYEMSVKISISSFLANMRGCTVIDCQPEYGYTETIEGNESHTPGRMSKKTHLSVFITPCMKPYAITGRKQVGSVQWNRIFNQ